MISEDTILFTLMLVATINLARYLTTLRALIYVMREAHPLLYQQVDGRGFFTTHGNVMKQVKLFRYIKDKEYANHHDPVFTEKCAKVRELFILFVSLLAMTVLTSFVI